MGVVDVGIEHAKLPNGVETDLAVIRHPGASAIVAIDSAMRVTMLRQYRYAVGQWLWEVPAGCRKEKESFIDCARRELGEEAGLSAARWDSLGGIVTIPSFCDERIELYLARDLSKGEGSLDQDEVIKIEQVAFDVAFGMIARGEIVDGKSIAALYRARDFLGG